MPQPPIRLTTKALTTNSATCYQITVQGRICESGRKRLPGWQVTTEPETDDPATAITTLHGTVANQADLHNVLGRLRDLGLPLLRVRCCEVAVV